MCVIILCGGFGKNPLRSSGSAARTGCPSHAAVVSARMRTSVAAVARRLCWQEMLLPLTRCARNLRFTTLLRKFLFAKRNSGVHKPRRGQTPLISRKKLAYAHGHIAGFPLNERVLVLLPTNTFGLFKSIGVPSNFRAEGFSKFGAKAEVMAEVVN